MLGRNWKILVTSFLPGPLINGFRSAALPSVLFQVSRDLKLSGVESGAVTSIQSATGIIFGIASGILTDRVGIRKTFRIGMLILSLGFFLTAFSFDFYTLLLVSFIGSFGVTIYLPPLLKMLASLFTDRQRGLAIGIVALALRLSAASTFLIVPLILTGLGSWRWVFLIFGTLAFAASLFIHYRLGRLTFEDPKVTGRFSSTVELKHILKSRNVVLTSLARLFLSGSSQSLSAFLPFLLQLTGASLFTASLAGTVFWLSQGAGVVLVPRLSDILNKRVLLITTLSPLATLLIFVMLFTWGNIALTFIIAACLGFIFAGVLEILLLVILADPEIGMRRAGGATGVSNSIGALGGIFSNLTVGSLIDLSGQNIWPIFTLIGALQLSMFLTSLFMREIKKKEGAE